MARKVLKTNGSGKRELRWLASSKENPLAGLIEHALENAGHWSVDAMREPGFLRLAAALGEDKQFRAAAPMFDKAQVQIDRAVVKVGLQRLTVAADIMAAGLTYNLADPLSVSQLEWSTVNKVGAAQRTMTPAARGENKQLIVAPTRLPIYLTTDTFSLDIRTLKTSQRSGMPLDTALVEQCTRAVNEAIEDAVINGTTTLDGQSLAVGGYTAPGLYNAPNAATTNITKAAWSGTSPVGATVFNEIQTAIGLLQANKKFGPYRLYLPTNISNALDYDYNATNNAQGLTIKQRLLQIESLQAIRTADLMTQGTIGANNVATGAKAVLMQMTSDVCDIVVGQEPTVIPWTSLDGFMIHNLVMAIMVPRVRSDASGQSGICVLTTA